MAAVLAAVAGLTFGLTGLASDTEQARRDYTPQTLPGEALVSSWGEAVLADTVRAAFGSLGIVEPSNVVPIAQAASESSE